MNYFVTAIGTDSGKTLVSAILCEAWGADYWKPIQAGYPRDTETVEQLVTNRSSRFHKETYLLNTPASPHAAAKIDGIEITLSSFKTPQTSNDLVIEGAGGCLVPINSTHFVIDIAERLEAGIILVANLYLGSINHTLLTVEALRSRNLPLKGIIFNGDPNAESESIILQHSSLPCLLNVVKEESITKSTILKYASILKDNTQK